jgi:hypothetical protein
MDIRAVKVILEPFLCGGEGRIPALPAWAVLTNTAASLKKPACDPRRSQRNGSKITLTAPTDRERFGCENLRHVV